MEPLKICGLCGCTSNDTAVFSCTYAKGELNICLECLTEGIIEITKEFKKPKISVPHPTEIKFEDFPLEEFDVKIPEQVFGFNCDKCNTVLFTNNFPVVCECGHINNEIVLQKQDLIRK